MSYLAFCVVLQIKLTLLDVLTLNSKSQKVRLFFIFIGSDVSYFRTSVLNISIACQSCCFLANGHKIVFSLDSEVYFPKSFLSINKCAKAQNVSAISSKCHIYVQSRQSEKAQIYKESNRFPMFKCQEIS